MQQDVSTPHVHPRMFEELGHHLREHDPYEPEDRELLIHHAQSHGWRLSPAAVYVVEPRNGYTRISTVDGYYAGVGHPGPGLVLTELDLYTFGLDPGGYVDPGTRFHALQYGLTKTDPPF